MIQRGSRPWAANARSAWHRSRHLPARYPDDLAIVWIDSHPDVDTPNSAYPGFHAMAVAALTGHGDPDLLDLLPAIVASDRVALAGLHAWTDDAIGNVTDWGITSFSPDDLRATTAPLLDWLTGTGCSRVGIHFDVDTIDSSEIVLGLGAEPDRLTSAQVRRIVGDITAEADVVGLTIAEFVPRQVMHLQALLSGFSLLGADVGRSALPCPGWLGLVGLEPGDGLRGGAGDLDEQLSSVIDAEAGIGLFDGDRSPGVADPDLDPLSGDGDGTADAAAPIHPQLCLGGCRGGLGRACVTKPGHLGGGERVRHRAQHGAVVVEQVQDAVVKAGGDPSSGQVVADRVLPSGQGERAAGVDRPVNLDCHCESGCSGGDRGRACLLAAAGQHCCSWARVNREGTLLSRTPSRSR